jgi:hypothetical protein
MQIVVNNKTRQIVSNVIGRYINSPEQRLLQGATALAIQPAFDYYNPKADKETRAVSTARTIGKIVSGTIVGIIVRYLSIALAMKFSNYKITSKQGNFVKSIVPLSKKDILTPNIKFDIPSKTVEDIELMRKNYTKTIGSFIACFTLLFTNFLVDAPLTKILTKIITPKINNKLQKQEVNKIV